MAQTEFLTTDEIWCICQILTPSNAAVVRTMLHTGMRIGDVLNLKKDALKRQFWVTEQKTGKRRRVNLTDDLIAEILAQTRPDNPWAFPGRKEGRPRTRQAVWADIKRAAKAFRVPANAGPHSLRKCFAVDLYHKSGDLDRVRRALNHDRPEVALLYAMADVMRSAAGKRRKPRRKSGGVPLQTTR